MSIDASFDDYLDQVNVDHGKFGYLEGPDEMGGGDSYAEGTPLHSVFESKESRVVAALLSENGETVSEQELREMSGVSNVGSVADQLEDQGIVNRADNGYQMADNREVYELARLEEELKAAWYAEHEAE